MDYPEWELERQREALRALLGGESRDGEALQKGGAERTDAEAAGRAGQAERSAIPDGTDAGPLERREADRPAGRRSVRRNGAGRPEGINGGPDSPASAWEQGLAGEEDAPGQAGWDDPGEPAPETPARPPREGTGPRAAPPGESGPAAREAETAPPRSRSGTRRAGRTGGETAAEGSITGFRLAKRPPAWAPETGAGGTGYRDGGFAAVPAEDGARALSRAVQRDARRYDGGFTIY